jgi:hypothetical protein
MSLFPLSIQGPGYNSWTAHEKAMNLHATLLGQADNIPYSDQARAALEEHQNAERPIWRPPTGNSLLVQLKARTQLNSGFLQEFIAATERLAKCTIAKLPYFIHGDAAHAFANGEKDWEVK